MSVRSSQSITALFTTRVFATGVGTNADSLPTGTLYVNGVANGATVTVANVSTGLYTAAVTLPTLAVGDEVEIIIAATVSSVSDKAVIWGDTKDVVIDSAGLVDANTVKLGPTGSGTAQTARDIGASVLLAASQHVIVDSGTVTTVSNQLTAAQIATGVWTDTTAGDFTAALSIGKSVMNGVSLGTGLTVNSLTTNADKTGYSLAANQHVIVDSGTVTTVTNQLTAAQIATGVWQDATAGDFTVASSIGKSLFTSGNAPGAASGLALVGSNVGTATSVSGAVGSVAAGVTVTTNNDKTGYSLTQTFPTNFSALGISAGGHISNVDTLTTYTGDTPQTGDSFARIGANGASLTALAPSSTALSTATWTGPLATSLTTLAGHDPGSTLMAASSYTAPLSAAGTRSALGMASANLDAQLAALDADVLTRAPLSTALSTVIWTNALATSLTTLAGHDPGSALASHADTQSALLAATGLDAVTVAGKTLPNAIKYIGAAVSGKCSGAGTGTETYDDFSGATAFVATIDTNGNRTGMAYS